MSENKSLMEEMTDQEFLEACGDNWVYQGLTDNLEGGARNVASEAIRRLRRAREMLGRYEALEQQVKDDFFARCDAASERERKLWESLINITLPQMKELLDAEAAKEKKAAS